MIEIRVTNAQALAKITMSQNGFWFTACQALQDTETLLGSFANFASGNWMNSLAGLSNQHPASQKRHPPPKAFDHGSKALPASFEGWGLIKRRKGLFWQKPLYS